MKFLHSVEEKFFRTSATALHLRRNFCDLCVLSRL